ncbi:MAG: hypothetical protein OJI70_05825 [Zavarzinia sp.]|nr:hypothetical protein [Zavarzinia sp.]
MTVSVWSTFTFAIRNTIRPVTLGFVGLHVANALVITTWMKIRIAQLAALNDPAAWQSYVSEINALILALSLLSLPINIMLLSRLSAQVFGRPLPVTWWQGSLRALKAWVIGFLALSALCVVLMLPVFLLQLALQSDQVLLFLPYALPALAIFWISYIHIFYFYGVLFKGRFGFRQARAYSRGRRARLFGGLALLMLAMAPIYILLMYQPIQPQWIQPYGSRLLLSAFLGVMTVAFQLLVLGHFFEAMDEADARMAASPPPEIVPTAFEG